MHSFADANEARLKLIPSSTLITTRNLDANDSLYWRGMIMLYALENISYALFSFLNFHFPRSIISFISRIKLFSALQKHNKFFASTFPSAFHSFFISFRKILSSKKIIFQVSFFFSFFFSLCCSFSFISIYGWNIAWNLLFIKLFSKFPAECRRFFAEMLPAHKIFHEFSMLIHEKFMKHFKIFFGSRLRNFFFHDRLAQSASRN